MPRLYLLALIAAAFISGEAQAQARFIAVESGSDQYGGGISFPVTFMAPLRAKVTTESGAPVPGAHVVFTVTSLDGTVRLEGGPEFRAVTDSQGIASVGPLRGLAGIGYFNMVANTEPPVPQPAFFILSQNPSPLCLLPSLPYATVISLDALPSAASGEMIRISAVGRFAPPSTSLLPDGRAGLFSGDVVIGMAEISASAPGRLEWDIRLPAGIAILRARMLRGCDWIASVSLPAVHVTRGDAQPEWNHTDMWWKPTESGWGMSLIQHASGQLFVVWYHYGESGASQWLVIPGGVWTTSSSFTGAIYRTTGPSLAMAFDPASVTAVPVGVATIVFTDADHGTFTWWFDNGSQGAKSITRQPF